MRVIRPERRYSISPLYRSGAWREGLHKRPVLDLHCLGEPPDCRREAKDSVRVLTMTMINTPFLVP
jgi:hypothetical protein